MISLELSSKDLGCIYQVDLMVSKYYNMSVYQFILRYKYDSLFIDIIKKVTEDYNYNKSSMIEIELDYSWRFNAINIFIRWKKSFLMV